MFKNILIVCVGNICRSPMAEGLLKQLLIELGNNECVVGSAGLNALVGYPPDPNAINLLINKDIDISAHRACQLNTDKIRRADLILVMESFQKSAIEEFEPSAKGKVFRLGHWGSFEIPDPYHQDISAFVTSLNLIEQGVAEWLRKL